jgi:hypothetical protein
MLRMKPLRDFLSVFGCLLLASGLCVFGHGIRAQVGLPLPGVGSTSGAPSGSGWDPSGKGTQASLSTTTVANDTAQAASPGFTSVRGVHGRSSGKFYYEVVALATATGNPGFGSMGASSAGGAGLDNPLGFFSNSAGVFTSAGNFATGTGWEAVSTGVYTVYNANVFGMALDMTNGFGYLAKANMWFLSGAPTSGATGTGHVIAFPATMIYPAVTLDDTSVVFKLVTGAGALTFSPPSGYSAWN